MAWNREFCPLGLIVANHGSTCTVAVGRSHQYLPTAELILISIRNNSNLRLVTARLDTALAALPCAVKHQLLTFTQQGDWAARAFADYATKIPEPILSTALAHLCEAAAGVTVTAAMDQVLGLNFVLITGQGLSHSLPLQ